MVPTASDRATGSDAAIAPRAGRTVGAIGWLTGAALLAAFLLVAGRRSEPREIARLVREADLRLLATAAGLQLLTYVCAAGVWQRALAGAKSPQSLRSLLPLGLAKLFLDQAVPSAGLSGTLLVERALERRGHTRTAALAAVLTGLVAFYVAYALSTLTALTVLARHGGIRAFVLLPAGLLCLVAVSVPLGLVALRRQAQRGVPDWLARWPGVRDLAAALRETAGRPLFPPRALLQTSALQLAIFALDAATLATALRALGVHADPLLVFSSFTLASVVSTLSWAPGGLGTFEASCVALLHWHGVGIEAALGATLLLRGLAFWLPMLPGFALARRELAARPTEASGSVTAAFWSASPDALLAQLGSSRRGLSAAEAARRLAHAGPNALRTGRRWVGLRLLARQFASPLVAILVFAASVSLLVRDWTDAGIVLAILVGSALLGFVQEYSASRAVEQLRARVRARATVLRDGAAVAAPPEEIVPGDVVLLSAGSLVPADGVLLEARALSLSETALTGEADLVEKEPCVVAADASLSERGNCVFMGTSVRSGTALALIVRTGAGTQLGEVADRLGARPPETEFERGIRGYGSLLLAITAVVTVAVCAVQLALARPAVESLLFALALAVAISPELLPAVIEVTLSHGAREMAERGVIVRRLNAIENFGAMDVLCTDKTATLTRGVLDLDGALDAEGAPSASVLQTAWENAALQTGLPSPLDDAIRAHVERSGDAARPEKVDEVPYTFERKRMSVVVRRGEGARLVMKGAFEPVLAACSAVRAEDGVRPLDAARREGLGHLFAEWSGRGVRVLGVATRELPLRARYGIDDEVDLVFEGLVGFRDPAKPDAGRTLDALRALGVGVKVVTGDNRVVSAHLAHAVGIDAAHMITGRELNALSDDALHEVAERSALFVEVDPSQKERIVRALRRGGHVVGFLGDGINDAAALHEADVGISVEGAVDVAKEAADFVLLRPDLDVLRRGIERGRASFANTLKYIAITTSANFGNMISMALASWGLPFLPLLAKQILLNNLLSDVPALALPGDRVDEEQVMRPLRFDVASIRRFMVAFGAISSFFDLLTFALLWLVVGDRPALFRTGWFVESLLTELAIIFVVRTRRPLLRSRPSRPLVLSSAAVALLTVALPWLPGAGWFDLVPLPPLLLAGVVAITLAYAGASEWAKRRIAMP